jgi:HK97 family phage prohead protease
MPVHAFPLEVKELSPSGQFRGIASTYGNVDLTGDVCMPGCFERTLAEAGKQRPLLWQHREPIGLVQLTDSPAGLICDGQFSMGVQAAKDAYTLTRDGVTRGLSVGYQTVKSQMAGDVRQLIELKLYEISLVTFPANEMATVSSVKAAQRQQDQIRAALKSLRGDVLGALEVSDRQVAPIRTKAGRTISAATRGTLAAAHDHVTQAHEHMKSAADILAPLLGCDCACPQCQAGDCAACSNSGCVDQGCIDCPNQA